MRKVFHIIPTCIKKCQLIQDSTKRDKWDSNADVLKGDKYFTILLPLSNITKNPHLHIHITNVFLSVIKSPINIICILCV